MGYTGRNLRLFRSTFFLVHFYPNIDNSKKFFEKSNFWLIAGQIQFLAENQPIFMWTYVYFDIYCIKKAVIEYRASSSDVLRVWYKKNLNFDFLGQKWAKFGLKRGLKSQKSLKLKQFAAIQWDSSLQTSLRCLNLICRWNQSDNIHFPPCPGYWDL